MTNAGWFTEPGGFIVETAWGRFQDTPIFRSLAREHNAKVTKLEMIDSVAGWYVPGEDEGDY